MQNQKPLGTRVLSLALTAAMVATMMPQTVFAEGTAPQVQGDTLTTTRTITAVGELGEGFAKSVPFDGHTYVLDVKANTPLSEVKLPTELSVTVEKITINTTAPVVETPVVETPAVETPVVETPVVSEATSTEPATPTTDANTTVLNNEPATPSGAEPAPVEKPAEVAPPVANQGNATIIETTQENVPVTWKGDKEYTAAPSSNVVYTAVLPEGYALKDGVVLPIINVMVGKKVMTPKSATSRAAKAGEQFSLPLNVTYYFDLSNLAELIGTINTNVPDTTLHYVPFTYAGTVNAYNLADTSSGVAGSSEAATASDRSLFVADYNISNTIPWNDLNARSLIFGRTFDTNYTLRSLSAGSGSTGTGATMKGTPTTNEWDSILTKEGLTNPIKNWDRCYSIMQDTVANDAGKRALRGATYVNFWGPGAGHMQYNDYGFRPALEVLNPGALSKEDLKAVTLDLNGGEFNLSTNPIQIVCAGANFKAPGATGLTRPSGNTGSYFNWNTQADGKGTSYAAGATVLNTVTTLYAQWTAPAAPVVEQFDLPLNGTYYFDLSGEVANVGTVNTSVPDTTLHYVPFTYVGTVNAYSLHSRSADAAAAMTDSVTADANTSDPTNAIGYKSDRSLFVSDYNISHSKTWNDLNTAGLIFGKTFDTNYKLRSLSVGNKTPGTPATNEWDSILNKIKFPDPIKNCGSKTSLGQDTASTNASNHAQRGYPTVTTWSANPADQTGSYNAFRPALEVLNPTALGNTGLKAVTLDLNGGTTDSKNSIDIICAGDTFKAPSGEGLTRPVGDTGTYFGWSISKDGSSTCYAVGDAVPKNVTKLYAQWNEISKVSFDARNGVAIDKVEINKDTGTIALPTLPKWTGYDFGGWYTGIDGTGNEVTASKVYTASTTVYAKWTKGGKTVYTQPLDFSIATENLSGDGYAWDNANKTLTLSGATIDCSGKNDTSAEAFGIKLNFDDKIVLTDGTTNTVKAGNTTAVRSNSFGVNFADGNGSCTISGKGTLDATGGNAPNMSCGIAVQTTTGTLTISDATINATSGTADYGNGIYAPLIINSGTITAKGTGITYSYGIQAMGMTMNNGDVTATGTVTGTGTNAGTEGIGITTESKDLTINGGKVTATGTETKTGNIGIGLYGENIAVNSGTIIANGTGSNVGYGISANNNITIGGGTVSATGSSADKASEQGISSRFLVMTGGTLSAKGNTAVFTINPITATGATVTGATVDIIDGTTKTLIQKDTNKIIPVKISFTKSVTFDSRGGSAVDDVEVQADGTIALPTPPTWGDYTFDSWWTGIDGTGDKVTATATFTANTTVYAKWTKGGKAVLTETLDLSTADADIDKLTTEGWKWDNGTKTLTLDGATIDCTGNAVSNSPVSGIQLMNDCNIVLADGTVNTVKAGNATDTVSIGINFKVRSGSATGASISGKGTLYATGGETRNGNMGIMCSDATLTVRDATIIAASSAETVTGVGIASKLDVKSGTITATGTGSTFGYGIQSMSMTMSGGTVTATGIATGTVGTEKEYGMYGMGEVNLTGGTLSASGKTSAITADDEDPDTTNDIIIAANATVTNGTVDNVSGVFESGVTKTLTQTDPANPVVISFTKAVTFDSRGGSAVQSAEIAENGTIAMPAAPTWGDYTFDGWYTGIDGTGTAFENKNLTASTTVYAKWTKGGKAVLTETLDLSTADADIDKLSTEGWKWDNATKTLTLSGITLNSAKLNADKDATGILLPNVPCTIILEDGTENTVDVSAAKNSIQSQVICTDSTLTIKTSGKGTPGKLNVIAANATDPTGTADPSIGIYAGGGIVIESGNITAKAGDSANDNSVGISANTGDIHIKGGTVNATGGKSGGTGMEGSFGMYGANVQIDDGKVTATGGAATNNLSAGIVGAANVKLSGGIINANGNFVAVAAISGDVVIDDIANVKVNDKLANVGKKDIGGGTNISTLVDDTNNIIADAAIKFKPTYKGENVLAPNAAKATRTHNTITLEAKTIAGEIVEYGIYKNGKIEWQPTPIFGSLNANTEYIFCIRVKANENHKAGATSAETTIKTKTAPVSVSGVVKDSDDNLLKDVKVELKQGGKLFMDAVTTGADGKYTFANVPEGVYSLVLTNGTVIITESVTVKGTVIDHKDMKFLKGNKNTEVQSDTKTEVAVSGMNDLLDTKLDQTLTPEQKNAVDAGGSVDLTLTANLKESADVGGDKGAIEAKAGEQEIALLLDLSVFRTVTDNAGNPVTDGTSDNRITELAGIITVHLAIPEHLQGKDGLSLYRMHEGKAEKLNEGQTAAVDGEYYEIDPSGTFMTLHLKKFSTYAFGCNTFDVTITGASGTGKYRNGDTVTINAGSKSGYTFDSWTVDAGGVTLANANSASTTFVMPTETVKLTANWTYTGGGTGGNPDVKPAPQVYYYINATTSKGGSINTPERVKVIAGGSASFTITPDKGYQIADVLVNGNSIGAKNSYVFTNVNADQTIHATFKKAGHRNPQTGVDANVD